MRSCTQYGDAGRKIKASLRLRHVAAFQTGRPVQKDVAVAGGCFRILIDGDDDRLRMLIAPALSGRETARCFERLQDVDMLSGQWQNKNGAVASAALGAPVDHVHFDWLWRERPARALRPGRDPPTRLRRTRVKSIENLGQRLLPILREA
jgi:hypothetical protein